MQRLVLKGRANLSYVLKDEWNKLSQSEKEKIYAGRKAQKACLLAKGGDEGGGGGSNGNKAKSKDKKSNGRISMASTSLSRR